MNPDTTAQVRHDPSGRCFTLLVDGHRCVLDYTVHDQLMTITHTGVPDALGGRGLAARLTKFALDHARGQHWKVVPRCSYAAVYIERHEEYADLLA